MIIQSPESPMPEPYKTYVRQRAQAIAEVLQDVVGETNVQLCPRAITEEERAFAPGEAIVYGSVVDQSYLGYKSDLYNPRYNNDIRSGIVARTIDEALAYTEQQLAIGNRVRLKDPTESDCQGQLTIESNDQITDYFSGDSHDTTFGTVLMPFMSNIIDEVSVGRIDLKDHGSFYYYGLESKTEHEGASVYGGTRIGLFSANRPDNGCQVVQQFDMLPMMAVVGRCALNDFVDYATRETGRVSIDVVRGSTDNGTILIEAVDVTPRVGGVTPAEVLAIQALVDSNADVCYARSRLLYDHPETPVTGKNFIDTASLKINAEVEEVVGTQHG